MGLSVCLAVDPDHGVDRDCGLLPLSSIVMECCKAYGCSRIRVWLQCVQTHYSQECLGYK